MASQKINQHVPILVVGAGFCGLITALLAKKLDLSFSVIEKHHREYHGYSNAHYLNAHTLEVLASLGVSMEALQAMAIDPVDSCRMVVCHRLNRTLHMLDLAEDDTYSERFKRVGRYGAHLNVRGTDLYVLLLQVLDREQIEVHYATSLIGLNKKNKHALLHTASKEQIICTYDVLLACDGAGSQVRQCVETFMRKSHYMDFLTIECHGSIVPYCADRAMLYWIYHEKITACMVVFDPEKIQVLQIPLLQDQNIDEVFASIKTSFAAVCGVDPASLQHRFTSSGMWRCQTGIVEQPDVACDSVYLLGDAWHQVLPAGGMGLNLAIADAYNLVWKLAADRVGFQCPWSQSYAIERHPIARDCVEQSVANFLGFLQMGVALFPKFLHGSPSWLSQLSKQPMSNVVQSAWLLGQRLLHDGTGQISIDLKRNCENNRSHFDGIAMHQPRAADGFLVYGSTKRCLYDLAILPHCIEVGRYLQHFPIVVDGQIRCFSDFLDYRHWTFFAYDLHHLQMLLHSFPVHAEAITLTPYSACPLRDGDVLVVRPDRVVFALVTATEASSWSSFINYCQHLLVLTGSV